MAPRPVKLSRALCFEESVWWDRYGLKDQTSVLPTFELLERLEAFESSVHRHVLGSTEFENYLSWRSGSLKTYGTLYLAFHGSAQSLAVGNKLYSLDDLADLIGELPNGVVHLGSCSVLRGNERGARQFLDKTRARLISGYERNVEWLDAAALDTAWLGYVATYSRLGDAERYFRSRYASVISHLKWQAYSRPRST